MTDNQQGFEPRKGIWVCDVCGATKDYEEEVICWTCGKGEMIYTRINDRH